MMMTRAFCDLKIWNAKNSTLVCLAFFSSKYSQENSEKSASHFIHKLTSVMMPIRSMSLAGLRARNFGVECPLIGGEELANEDAVTEPVIDLPGCILAKFRPSRLTLPTRFSISSARSSVDSFSSWINLKNSQRFKKKLSCISFLSHPTQYNSFKYL